MRMSYPAQPRDEGACREKLLFIKRRVCGMAATTQRFKRSIDLAECGLGHGGVPPPLGKEHQRDAFVAKTPGPVERHALARPFLQRVAIGPDRLLQPRRSALARAAPRKRIAGIGLRRGPLQRPTLARPFL